jgi:hypothetical protein
MLRFVGLITTLAAAAVVASPAAFSAPTPSPCKLVSAADAKASLGVAVGKPILLPAGRYQSCIYGAASKTRLVILTRRLSKPDFTKSAKANPGPVVAVAGIGSSAYSAGGGASLLVWKNGTEVALSIFGIHAPLHAEEQLAKEAVAKL